jgi:hypothetical protein
MKKIKYIASIWLFSLLVSMVSCRSDDKFLTENPKTFYTSANAFTTSSQIDQVLVSIYSHLRDLWANPTELGWIFVFKGNGTDMYDVPNIRRGNNFNNYGNINPQISNFYEIYSNWYYVISRANLALNACKSPQISWSSAAEKDYAVAQARFFRAFAYRNLAELFGGVPIVTDISLAAKFDFKRSTRVETYQFAITEMEAIEPNLPEITGIGGRLVKGAAQHNLCELYLAMGTQLAAEGKGSEASTAFAKSISFGNKVIDGGTYALTKTRFGTRKASSSIAIKVYQGGNPTAPVDTVLQETNYYWDMFQEGNVNYQDGNKECIWAMQIDYAAYRAEDKRSKLPFTRSYGSILRDAASSHLVGMLEDLGGRGVGQIIPTFYTRDDVYAGKWGDDLRNSDIVFRRRFKGNVAQSPYFKNIVPWSVIYNSDPSDIINKDRQSMCYPLSCKITTDQFTGLADGENRSNLFRDNYFIRLSETILLRAEAKQRSGDKGGAAADINLLRDRANCTYKVTATDMDDNFNTILDERARELIYEECRWNTLLRMGGTIAVDRIKKYAFWPEAKATLTFNYNLWPIPQTVIDTNKDLKLEQNPGW